MSETDVTYHATEAEINEYRTLQEAAQDPRVPYKVSWLRILCDRGTVEAQQFGSGQRSVWLIHMPSLLRYVDEMKRQGNQRFNPW